ncbi:MAG: exodeoxyribonuclease VII small subunit [Lachnospiraceae bacterium]|nr:exodeoxyribonuclease VII small subunit [Lachnospiraceae bacterium]
MSDKKVSVEELLLDIEKIVDKMEEDDVTLEDSFTLYEDGMKKLKEANALLDTVAKKVEALDAEGNSVGELEVK